MEQDAPVFFSTPYPELNAILEQVYRHRGADGRGSLRQLSEAVDKLVEKWAAASAPADSVTAPAGGAVAGSGWKWVPKILSDEMVDAWASARLPGGISQMTDNEANRAVAQANWDAMIDAAPTPPAQAADSVLEDAARYQWLADYLIGDRTDLDDEIVACGCVYDLSMAVDAARKQGANHD